MSGRVQKGSPDSDIKEDFIRRFKQEETCNAPRADDSLDGNRPPAGRTNEYDRSVPSQHISAFQRAQGCLNLSTSLRPTHLFHAQQAVSSLNERLQEIRTASAPKRKFAFKKTDAQRKTAISGSGLSEDVSVQDKAIIGKSAEAAFPNEPGDHNRELREDQDRLNAVPDSGASGAIAITSLLSTYYRPGSDSSKPGSSMFISKIHHSAVDLSDSLSTPFATLAINSIKESFLICGRVTGAAHITAVENSTLVVWSRQIRMHECRNCLVYLRCSGRPIIEDCENIRFTPLPPIYNTTESLRPMSPNLWDQVDDFKWLRAERSPHWSTLQPGDEGAIGSGLWEVTKSFASTWRTTSELDDLLKAAKVI